MAQPFSTHPGMGGHPGVAHGGQPMVHGHPSNQGVPVGQQSGVSMGPQIHPQGGPQVSQAGPMMGGMMQGGGPPGVSGVGPSQHALSHLNPHQNPQLYAQQQQQQQQIQHACKLYVLFLSCFHELRRRPRPFSLRHHRMHSWWCLLAVRSACILQFEAQPLSRLC